MCGGASAAAPVRTLGGFHGVPSPHRPSDSLRPSGARAHYSTRPLPWAARRATDHRGPPEGGLAQASDWHDAPASESPTRPYSFQTQGSAGWGLGWARRGLPLWAGEKRPQKGPHPPMRAPHPGSTNALPAPSERLGGSVHSLPTTEERASTAGRAPGWPRARGPAFSPTHTFFTISPPALRRMRGPMPRAFQEPCAMMCPGTGRALGPAGRPDRGRTGLQSGGGMPFSAMATKELN